MTVRRYQFSISNRKRSAARRDERKPSKGAPTTPILFWILSSHFPVFKIAFLAVKKRRKKIATLLE